MDKWTLITGAAKRIGKGIAKQLHAEGYNIIIHYSNSFDDATRLQSSLNKIRPYSAKIMQAEFSNQVELERFMEALKKQNLPISVLINNAAEFYATPLSNTDYQTAQQLLATNLLAPYFLAEQLAPTLKEHNGCIINLIDIHAKRPLKDHGLYSISKAALEMATLSLAQELAPDIRVNGVAPGAILWPENSDDDSQQQVLKEIPLAKLGQAEDIANLVSHLVSAPYISGQIIAVDGGRSAVGFTGA
ncbi:Short-chain dehydrogenase/reductase SDR [Shewanella piezotolerans WP3]|uniref:Short-chain dehydrogenase/reductase SDR n=1 Tax=Shewanella piezotolerans (strain WP3 / JCM 13877) TaxID=225849 RepID=B8CME6_SHEPW|nr:pteridine reductase [Shewanella piezotolerans]ACJ29203.1 Short-chain dehydrogenase/reductase SDR [Shewanella piezotolerans WP3]